MGGRAGIDDERNQAIEFRANMLGRGGAEPAKPVRAWRGQRATKGCADLAENGMGTEPNGDSVEASRDNIRDHRLSRKNKGQRARPELFMQLHELIGD